MNAEHKYQATQIALSELHEQCAELQLELAESQNLLKAKTAEVEQLSGSNHSSELADEVRHELEEQIVELTEACRQKDLLLSQITASIAFRFSHKLSLLAKRMPGAEFIRDFLKR